MKIRTTKIPQVTIMTFGSRGDIQPFIALAIELQESKKYDVRFLTNLGYKDFVEDFGLTYVPVWPGSTPDEMLKNNKTVRDAMSEGSLLKFMKAFGNETKEHAAMNVKLTMDELMTYPPDLFVAGSLTDYWEYYVHMVMKKPVINMELQTVAYSRDHAPHGLPVLPFGLHYYLIMAMFRGFYDTFHNYDAAQRQRQMTALTSVLRKKISLLSSVEN